MSKLKITDMRNEKKLLQDALVTSEKSGLLPSELLTRRDELVSLCKRALILHARNPEDLEHILEIEQTLNKIEGEG